MTSDEQLEGLLHKMRSVAPEYAKAKADRVYLEQFRKSKKAMLFRDAPSGTVADKENYAYSHAEYLQIIDGLREATKIEEELKIRLKAAELSVEIWRTQQANMRSEKQGYGAQ